MVKGISRQVVVVHSPDQKLFDQAIFILKDNAAGVTDETLMREAKALIRENGTSARKLSHYGPVWACGGALLTGLVWLLTALL